MCFDLQSDGDEIIIIIYIYRALTSNLNMIFCTHIQHSPIKKNLHKVLYGNIKEI